MLYSVRYDYSELIKNADSPDFLDTVAELAKKLLKLYKVKTVIVTGIEHKISDEVTKINNLIAADDEVFCVSCEKTAEVIRVQVTCLPRLSFRDCSVVTA